MYLFHVITLRYGQAVILSDFNSISFPHLYLDPHPEVKKWYFNGLNKLDKFDLFIGYFKVDQTGCN